jgi:excisionase family DNA binding protein
MMSKTSSRANDSGLRSIEEAQEFLGCGRSRVYELIKNGKLHSVKFGRLTRITQRSLDCFVAELTASADRNREC